MEVTRIEPQRIGDSRGGLLIVEAHKNVPFDIKRVYCIHGLNNMSRGFHAHKELKQVMICLSGSCRVVLDSGLSRKEIIMNWKSDGIFIDKMIWREMHDFSNDCVLMILASDWYRESDYIRAYEEFIVIVNEKITSEMTA